MRNADEKLAELIVYVSRKCEADRRFGAIKLNKILFFSDFIAFGRSGKSITGQEYQRLPQGPAPRRLLPVRDDLIAGGSLEFQAREHYGKTQKRTVALRDPDLSLFTGAELALVDEVIDGLWNAAAVDASELSHLFPGWKYAIENETIPYETVFISDRPLTQAEKDHALTL